MNYQSTSDRLSKQMACPELHILIDCQHGCTETHTERSIDQKYFEFLYFFCIMFCNSTVYCPLARIICNYQACKCWSTYEYLTEQALTDIRVGSDILLNQDTSRLKHRFVRIIIILVSCRNSRHSSYQVH